MARAPRVAAIVALLAAAAGPSVPAGAVTEPPTPVLALSWDGTAYSTSVTDVFGDQVIVPGDTQTRTLSVRNDGPTAGTVTVSVDDVILTGAAATSCAQMLTVAGVPVESVDGTVVLHDVVNAGATTTASIDYALDAATTGCNAFAGEPAGISFVLGVEILGLDQADLAMRATAVDDSGDGIAQEGEHVRFVYEVINTGGSAAFDLSVTETSLGGTVTLITTTEDGFDGVLSPGEMVRLIHTYRVTAADMTAGSVTSTARADASTAGDPVQSNETRVVVATPPSSGLEMVKAVTDANGDGFAQVGEELVYTFTVRNLTGAVLYDLDVVDQMLGDTGVAINDPAGFTGRLEPRDLLVFTSDPYVVTAADVTSGSVANLATAHAVDSGPTPIESNTSTVDMPTAGSPVIILTGSGAGTSGPSAVEGALLGGSVLVLGSGLVVLRRRTADARTADSPTPA